MNQNRVMRCGECGKKDMKYENTKGRTDFVWKNFTNIKMEVDLFLMTCPHCSNVGIWSNEGQMIDDAIVKSLIIQGKINEGQS